MLVAVAPFTPSRMPKPGVGRMPAFGRKRSAEAAEGKGEDSLIVNRFIHAT